MTRGLLIKKENEKLSAETVSFDGVNDVCRLLDCRSIDTFSLNTSYGLIACYCDEDGRYRKRPVTLLGKNEEIYGPILCFNASNGGTDRDITMEQMGILSARIDVDMQVVRFRY